MKDIEKYIFDPENPKEFKASRLLSKLLNQKNTIAYIDRFFLIEIFNKDIFDSEYKHQLWDIPENYNELTILDKKRLYENNYSEREFNDYLISKINEFSPHKLSSFISSFIGEENKLANFVLRRNKKDGFFKSDPYFNTYNKLNKKYLQNALEGQILKDLKELDLTNYNEIIFNKNIIFIINEKKELDIIKKFELLRSSILITSINNQEEFSKKLSSIKYLKPIFLKRNGDIHKLIELFKRNLKENNKKSLYNNNQDYANSFKLKDYFSIKNIEIAKLSTLKEIYFLGENGDGKSLILQAILLSLKGNLNIGVISDFVKQNTAPKKLLLEAIDSLNKKYKFIDGINLSKEKYENIFAYGVNRFQNDSDKKDQHGFLTLFSHNEYLENPVKWLQHLDYQEKSDNQSDIPLEKAKKLLNELLEENVEIEVSPSGVDFYERGTKLKFEQLSDGYKSVLVWICDLLSRLAAKQPDIEHISDFHGIVLVDEIGMFLHPKWQRTIVKKLRTTFPNIQFFFTTHSPIVLLGASEDAVFYKVYKEDGETKVSDPIENKSLGHLMANGIITAPFLFGLESARSESYNPKTDNLETSDDYLTGKIHEAVSKKIATKNNISEDQIMDLIQKELDKYEAQTND